MPHLIYEFFPGTRFPSQTWSTCQSVRDTIPNQLQEKAKQDPSLWRSTGTPHKTHICGYIPHLHNRHALHHAVRYTGYSQKRVTGHTAWATDKDETTHQWYQAGPKGEVWYLQETPTAHIPPLRPSPSPVLPAATPGLPNHTGAVSPQQPWTTKNKQQGKHLGSFDVFFHCLND